MKIDYQNIAKVIADTSGKPADRVQDDMNNRTTLNPQEAKDYGLVHDIKSELFPAGADILVVGEDVAMPNMGIPAPMSPQQINIPLQTLQGIPPQSPQASLHITEPNVNAFTISDGIDNGTYF